MNYLQIIYKLQITSLCLTVLTTILWVSTDGIFTLRDILLCHQNSDGLWRNWCRSIFIIYDVQRFLTWRLLFSLESSSLLIRGAHILILIGFDGSGNLTSGILAATTSTFSCCIGSMRGGHQNDLGVFSPSVDNTVAGCHELILGIFCNSYKLLVDDLTQHYDTEFCCELLPCQILPLLCHHTLK